MTSPYPLNTNKEFLSSNARRALGNVLSVSSYPELEPERGHARTHARAWPKKKKAVQLTRA